MEVDHLVSWGEMWGIAGGPDLNTWPMIQLYYRDRRIKLAITHQLFNRKQQNWLLLAKNMNKNHLPLLLPVILSRRTFIWWTLPNSENILVRSLSSIVCGIWPTNIFIKSGSGWSPPMLTLLEHQRISWDVNLNHMQLNRCRINCMYKPAFTYTS